MMYDIFVRRTPESRWELFRAWSEDGLADCLIALNKYKVKPKVTVYPAVDVGSLVFNLKTLEYRQVQAVGFGTVDVSEEGVDGRPKLWSKSDIVPISEVNVAGVSCFGWCSFGYVLVE